MPTITSLKFSQRPSARQGRRPQWSGIICVVAPGGTPSQRAASLTCLARSV